MFDVHLIGDLRCVAKENWAITLPCVMGRNGVTYRYGCGGNGYNGKVAEKKELILELGALVWEGRLPRKRLERI